MEARTGDTFRAVLRGGGLLRAGRIARDAAAWDSAVRAPVGTSRRITFVAADGGTGTTTLAAAVALTFAHRRTGPVLALDATGGPSALRARLGTEDVPPLDDVAYGSPVRSLADAREVTREARPGLHLAGASGWPSHPSAWTDAAAAVGRFFEVVVTDAGRRIPDDAVTLAAASHVTAVVARTDAGSFAAGRALADSIRDALPRAPVVFVLVGVSPAEPPFVHGGRAGSLAVPHDHAAARSLGTPLPQLAPQTRAAVAHAAAELLTEARSV
jgi:hypothetical protein